MEIEAAAEDIIAEQPGFLRLGNGGAQAAHGQRILRADVDIALVAAGGAAREHHALDDGVRVALHDGLIHERAGVALVTVADHVFLALRHPADALPLLARGEACAAAAAQTGIGDLCAGLLRRHFEQRLFQRFIAAVGQIFVEILGVGVAARLKNDAALLFIERNVVVPGVGVLAELVEQALDDLAAADGLFENFFAVLRMDVGVEDTLRLDLYQRAHFAEALTAAPFEVERIFAALFAQRNAHAVAALAAQLGQALIDLHGAARDAAGARADKDDARIRFGQSPRLCAAGSQIGSCGKFHSAAASFARISSSRATALSGSIFAWTSPSMVMTGARPHAPRHATVSSVNRPSSDVFCLPRSFRCA